MRERVGLVVRVSQRVPLADADAVPVRDALCVRVGEREYVRERVDEPDGDCERVGVSERVCIYGGLALGLAVAVADAVCERVCERVCVCAADAVRLVDSFSVRVSVVELDDVSLRELVGLCVFLRVCERGQLCVCVGARERVYVWLRIC